MKRSILIAALLLSVFSIKAQYVTSVVGESSPGACDGSALFQLSTPVFGGTVVHLTLDATSYIVSDSLMEGDTIGQVNYSNLCADDYFVLIADTLGNNLDTIAFTITSVDSIVVTNFATNETGVGACDGTVLISTFGGTPPYTITVISDDSTLIGTGANLTGLCPGLYNIQAIDANGFTGSQSFIIVDATSFYGPPSLGDSVYVDTLSSSAIQACNINFNNVTNVSISNYYTSVNGDSIIVDWFIETPDALPDLGYIISQIYYFDSSITTGNLLVTMDLYCPVTKSLAGSLKAANILSLGQLSTKDFENNSFDFQFYPNPTNQMINVRIEKGDYSINIYSADGKIVLSNSEELISGLKILDVSFLENGMYYFELIRGNQKSVKKFIKE